MAGRFGLCMLAWLGLTLGTAERAAAEVRQARNRPGIFEVGEPILISREGLRREMDRNNTLREYIDLYGWPDYAEVQQTVVQEPLAPYEVRVYYLQRNQEYAFTRANISPNFTGFGIRKYEGLIAPETVDRLLTARAAMEAQAPPPEPAAAAAEPAPPAVPEQPAATEPSSAPAEDPVPAEAESPPVAAGVTGEAVAP